MLNADGSPSVGAEVFMIHGSGAQVAQRIQDNLDDVPEPAAITDRDGKFELTHAETAVALLARAPDGRFVLDRGWKSGKVLQIEKGVSTNIEVRRFDGARVSGARLSMRRLPFVLDEVGGALEPVSDKIELAMIPALRWESIANAAGATVLEGLTPGFYRVEVSEDLRTSCTIDEVVYPGFSYYYEIGGNVVARGRVLDAETRRPIQRAIVSILDGKLHCIRARPALTNPEGIFELEVPLRGLARANLGIRAVGYAGTVVPLPELVDQAQIEKNIDLEAGSEISGRVVDSKGIPVAGAAIFVRLSAAQPVLARRFSTRSGEFSIDELPSKGRLLLTVTGPACADRDVVVENRGRLASDIVIERGGTIVLDLRGIPPLSSLNDKEYWQVAYRLEQPGSDKPPYWKQINARDPKNHLSRVHTPSAQSAGSVPSGTRAAAEDPSATLEIPLPTYSPGRHLVRITIPGRVVEDATVDVPSSSEAHLQVNLRQGESVKGRIIMGRNGSPLVGADVSPMEPRDANGTWGLRVVSRAVKSDAAGMFELSNLPIGVSDICIISDAERVARVVQVSASASKQTDLGDIVVYRYASVKGKVSRASHHDDNLELAIFDATERACGSIPVPADGAYAIDNLLAGRYAFELRARRQDGACILRKTFEVGEEETVRVDFEVGSAQLLGSLLPAPASSDGTVRTAVLTRVTDGELVAKARVDPYGRFEMSGLAPGTYQIDVRANLESRVAVSTAQAQLQSGRNEVIIRRSGTEAELRVVDSKGEPVKGATMRARRIGAPPVLLGDTDEKGEIRVEDLEPGTFVFSLRAAGFEEVFRSTLALKPSSQETQVIRLARESLLTVRTLDLRDRPLSAAQVRVSRLDGMAPRTLLESTDGLGSVQFQKLGAGEHTIFVKPAGRGFPVKLVRKLAADSSHIETLKIRNTGTLEVRVINKEGVAMSDVAVDATVQGVEGSLSDWTADGWVEVESGSAVTDSQGKLTIRRFPEGQATVSAPGAVSALATVKSEETATATLHMP
ncbi:MAG: carboxypeptidase regulatory-like domain-containing protein [Planctomycetes bacterium]|nr:carboxypeptidase regulatory-like domain-containing protein [Planctomycetota bacterium]